MSSTIDALIHYCSFSIHLGILQISAAGPLGVLAVLVLTEMWRRMRGP